jgi:dipeptidyl aminopeptidase/acylaminoacyl peptidase
MAVVVVVGSGAVSAAGSGSVGVPRVSQVFLVHVGGRHVQQLTAGPVAHSNVQWLGGERAVAEVASGASAGWIERSPVDGSAGHRLSPSLSGLLAFSPASGLTVIGNVNENTNVNTIGVVGPPGSHPRVLDRFFQNAGPQVASWSANGHLIAYARPFGRVRLVGNTMTAGPQHIVVMASDGRGRRVLTHGSGNDFPPLFSRDGRSLLFYRSDGSRSGLYIVGTRGGPARRISPGDGLDRLAWSPNGRQIAFTGWWNGIGDPYLFLVDIRTGHVKRLAGSVQLLTPAWSRDSTKIAFATERTVGAPTPPDRYAAVETINADGTGRRALARIPGSITLDLAWSRDGTRIAFTIAPQPTGD